MASNVSALSVWWRALRPHSFTASVTPVFVGAAAASYEGALDSMPFLVTLLASVAIHAGTNLANDYYDHVRGVDTSESPGPSGVIQQGLLPARHVLTASISAFAFGGLLGLYLMTIRGWIVLLLGMLGVLAGFAYTGGPLPLGYIGLGDLSVFAFMGMAIVLGTYFVLTGSISATAVWAALPMAALVTAILVVNNLRDIDEDRAAGKRTLATFLGEGATRVEFLLLVTVAYAAVIVGIIAGALPYQATVVLITIPRVLRVWQVVRAETDRRQLTALGLRGSAQLHFNFGLLLAAAFLVSR
ncbi:MAG: 1,4-dihydroxy-2-naphthoate octaprenyltransferase [bacterium]